MTIIRSPYCCAWAGAAGSKALKLLLITLMLCCGQMAFATGWGGIEATKPQDGSKEGWFKNSGTLTNPYNVESNAGGIGTAKSFTDYTTGACGIRARVWTSGGCSSSGDTGQVTKCGGAICCDSEATLSITINDNATTACTINYWGDADSNDAVTRTQTIKIKQHVHWSGVPVYKVVDEPAYKVTAYGGNIQGGSSGLSASSYSSTDTSVCTVDNAGNVTNQGRGWCKINVSGISGNGSWTAAPASSVEWYVKGLQTITPGATPAEKLAYDSFDVSATTQQSGLPVQISASGYCSGNGEGTATILASGEGTCTIKYNQPGSNTWAAAATVTRTVSISKRTQSITFPAQPDKVFSPGASFVISPQATATSGYMINYTSNTPTVCTLSGLRGDVVTMKKVGTCEIVANQSGDGGYEPAAPVTQSFAIIKATPEITVTQSAPGEAASNTSFDVAATASNGDTVNIGVSGDCSIAGATVTVGAIGNTCTVEYSLAATANYNAVQVSSDTLITRLGQYIEVLTPPPASIAWNNDFSVQAAATSGLGVAITTSGGGCDVISGGSDSATIRRVNGTQPCVVHFNQSGDSTYSSADEITREVGAVRNSQLISIDTPAPVSAAEGASFSVAASASSGLPVAITTSGACSGSGTGGASISMDSGSGNCTVIYQQAGDDLYSPAQASNVVSDVTVPVLAAVTPVPAVTGKNPRFTFSSTEPGSIVYGGACSSVTQVASSGDNQVAFEALDPGVYSDCTVQVEDSAGNLSAVLSVNSFEVIAGMTVYVKPQQAGAGDCSSWANACDDIQQAIDISAVDEIWLAAGVYRPTASLQLKPGLAIYGGFTGKETSRSKANPARNLTVISGDTAADDAVNSKGLVTAVDDVAGTNLARLLVAENLGLMVDQQVILSGLVLNAASGSQPGAALSVDNARVLLESSQLLANSGSQGGALALSNNAQLVVKDSGFAGNRASAQGGAIYVAIDAGQLQVAGSVFDRNSAATSGGAIAHIGGALTLINSTFFANSLSAGNGRGGAIDLAALAYPASATIKYVTLVQNNAGEDSGRGGAIHVAAAANATIELANTLALANTAKAAANIADMSRIADSGYNVVGADGSSGMLWSGSTAHQFSGTSTTAPAGILPAQIVEAGLANNGGKTATLFLKKDSFARDRIPNIHKDCGVSSAVGKDQRGMTRPDEAGAYCDVGAVEYGGRGECEDIDRQSGFFIGYYPASQSLCVSDSNLSLSGRASWLVLLLLGVPGLYRLRYRKE